MRGVKPAPGSHLALFTEHSHHAFITDREGDPRRYAEVEHAIRDLKHGVGLNHSRSGRFAANAAWLAVRVPGQNLSRWTGCHGLGQPLTATNTLRQHFVARAGRITRKARRLTLHLPQARTWQTRSAPPWHDGVPCRSP